MAIVNTLSRIMPGFGSPAVVYSTTVTNAISSTTTTTISNANLGNIPYFHSGYVRVKSGTTAAVAYPGTGAGQATAIVVSVSDGTSTIKIKVQGTLAASDLFDLLIPFIVDIDAVTVSVAVTMANVANGQLVTDIEVGVTQ